MIFIETGLSGAYLIKPNNLSDKRGYFSRVWCAREFEKRGLKSGFVQANRSYSKAKGTIRGLHLQMNPDAEVKLMGCIRGSIWDVIIDLRQDSHSYKKWFGIELSAKEHTLLYVPEGFAHGYQTLEENSEVFYPTTNFYEPSAERGIRWNDATFNIEWPITENIVISDKDSVWPDYDPSLISF